MGTWQGKVMTQRVSVHAPLPRKTKSSREGSESAIDSTGCVSPPITGSGGWRGVALLGVLSHDCKPQNWGRLLLPCSWPVL